MVFLGGILVGIGLLYGLLFWALSVSFRQNLAP